MNACASAAMLGLCALATATAQALDVQHAVTRYHGGRYELELEATLHAPATAIERVLRDYAAYPQLDHRVLDAKVLNRVNEHELLLYSRIRACFAFICRGVERVERVEERPFELVASAVPERSDVKFGLTETRLQTVGPSTTHLMYRTQIEPKFWVPRVFGRRTMLNTLRDATIELFDQVERSAQAGGWRVEAGGQNGFEASTHRLQPTTLRSS
jgi:hypothetical protein